MNLFTCFIHFAAQRKFGRFARWEDGVAQIVVLSLDEADAVGRANAWFEHQLELGEWSVMFGSGMRDALSVRLRGPCLITAHDEGAIAVIRVK